MAPANNKRKRLEPHDSNEDVGNRPSPHRPQNLPHALQAQDGDGSNSRRGSRSGARGNSTVTQSPTTHSSPAAAPAPPVTQSPAVVQPNARSTAPSATESAPQQPSNPNLPSYLQCNEHVTQERTAAWNGPGRQAVVTDGVQAQHNDDVLVLSLVFEELVQACVDGVLTPNQVGSVVQEIVTSSASAGEIDSVSVFLGSVSTLSEDESFAKKHGTVLRQMLEDTAIDAARMRAELEDSLLTVLHIVRPTFNRVAIRKATQAVYRQSNYNLLREESEGYSKLITDLFTVVHNAPPNNVVVAEMFERIKALIGAFDLDVGRALDVTLDVFANLLVKHSKFFVKLLRISSWWPEQQNLFGAQWQEPFGISSLPQWAHPDNPLWYYTEEEAKAQLQLREKRDRMFWDHLQHLSVPQKPKRGELRTEAYFKLTARAITSSTESLDADAYSKFLDGLSEKDKEKIPDSEIIHAWCETWMAKTKTMPPTGNRIAAQLLGFKLQFYASDARDPSDKLPDNVMWLAALLIKIGFISILDLFPHLYPSGDDMKAHKDNLMEAKKKRDQPEAAENALTKGGPLSDEPTPGSRVRDADNKNSPKSEADKQAAASGAEDAKSKLPEPGDQVAALLRSLLCIGAIPEALFIIGEHPWLLDVYDDLQDYFFRLLHRSLSNIYEETNSSNEKSAPTCCKMEGATGDAEQELQSDFVPRKMLRWAKMEENDAIDGNSYRFYWDDWADNVPVCQTVDDIFKLCNTLVLVVGPKIGRDSSLLSKLVRIGAKDLDSDPSEQNQARWVSLCKSLLAPALAFSEANPGLANEAFELFKHFDTETRYSIYELWTECYEVKRPGSKKGPELLGKAKPKALEQRIRGLYNRLSHSSINQVSRPLAKLAAFVPGLVFSKARDFSEQRGLGHFNVCFAEACRFLTPLAFDCLNMELVVCLSKPRKGSPALQADGMNLERSYKSVIELATEVYKRHAAIELAPVLELINDELYKDEYYVLFVLGAMIKAMGGIGSDMSYTKENVLGFSWGRELRSFTLQHYLGDTRHETTKPAMRLVKTLVDKGLAAQILIVLGQQLEFFINRNKAGDEQDAHPDPVKVAGSKLDNFYAHFYQFLDFLRSNLEVDDFDQVIPDVVKLISEYELEPSVAFAISRESLTKVTKELRIKVGKSVLADKVATASPDADVVMGGIGEQSLTADRATTLEDVEMMDAATQAEAVRMQLGDRGTNPHILALATRLKSAAPGIFADKIQPTFLVTFWQLSLKDIHYNDAPYDAVRRLKKKQLAAMKPGPRGPPESLEDRNRRSDVEKALLRLDVESKEMLDSVKNTQACLKKEMQCWFDGWPMVTENAAEIDSLYHALLQNCFLPRALQSQQDAQFAVTMLFFMHESGAPGFRTVKLFDHLFRKNLMRTAISMCTALEAENLGQFLNEILDVLRSWHEDKGSEPSKKPSEVRVASYNKAVLGKQENGAEVSYSLPGFGKSFKDDRSAVTAIQLGDFRTLLFKWHSQLYRALDGCIKTKDYTTRRNAILVLKALTKHFPAVDSMGAELKGSLLKIYEGIEAKKLDDVGLAASSLQAELSRLEPTWVTQEDFKNGLTERKTPLQKKLRESENRSGSRGPAQQPSPASTNTKSLNASAPAFNPPSAPTNGTPRTASTNGSRAPPSNVAARSTPTNVTRRTFGNANIEQEDGEVEDSKKPNTTAPPTPVPQAKTAESRTSTPKPYESKAAAQSQDNGPVNRNVSQDSRAPAVEPNSRTAQPSPIVDRPESKAASSSQSSRTPHALPTRPDASSASRPLQDRPPERPSDYRGYSRHDPRANNPSDYGRVDRPTEPPRDAYREASPGRRTRGRTPDRIRERSPDRRDRDRDHGWGPRDPRDYPDDRSMRPPPRDTRGPNPGRGPGWSDTPRDARDMRDSRDLRDLRERAAESRAPLPTPFADNRGRMHPNQPPAADQGQYRRDFHQPAQPTMDRSGGLPPRSHNDRQSYNAPASTSSGPPTPGDRSMINPDRAAIMENDRSRPDGPRPDRDVRHDRSSRPQSPRRADERSGMIPHGRGEAPRDPRDDRMQSAPTRERRDEAPGNAPTGPSRGPRPSFPSSHGRGSVDLSHGRLNQDFGQAPPRRQEQDPNYGRLNQPPRDTATPSAPKGKNIPRGPMASNNSPNPLGHQGPSSPATNLPPTGPSADRRDPPRREPAPSEPNRSFGQPPPGPAQQDTSGIHPDRLKGIFTGPPLQTDMGPPPSGPRASAQTPNTANSSPVTRNPPPRGPSGSHRTFSNINNILTGGGAPTGPGQSSIRGRAPRTSGANEFPGAPGPEASSTHPDTPTNGQGVDKSDSRNPRDGRRSERSGRNRSRSLERGDRRTNERSARDYDPERAGDWERGSGRDKRASDRGNERGSDRGADRDGARREKDREGERSGRDGRDRRERGARDESKGSVRTEESAPRRSGPPGTDGQANWGGERRQESRNGEARSHPSGERRDDRDKRGGRDDGRDRSDRKRHRRDHDPNDDRKRPRISQGGN